MTGHSSWEEQKYLYPHDYRDKFPVWEREFNIQPFKYERARLPFRMTNEERLWRKQWLQDQVLAADEPKYVPNLDKLHKNPIRYRWMVFWDSVFNRLRPVAVRIRQWSSRKRGSDGWTAHTNNRLLFFELGQHRHYFPAAIDS